MAEIDRDSHTAGFVCPHIFRNERLILLVSHEDGDWQFLCGESDHAADGHVVGIGHLVERDPTLLDLVDLPLDWEAERANPGEPWLRTACSPDQ